MKTDDPRLATEMITYPSPKGGGPMKAQLSKPGDAKNPLGGVVVVHENRGLNPYIMDVGRRLAVAGFISIAPDALTPLGGYPGDDDKGREMQAERCPDLAAGVPFYGAQPPLDEVAKIKAPLLIHYAGLDTRVNEGWPAYENALKENKKEYTAYIYPNVNHGFHNDTTPRYDKTAAELAWQRTLEFFTQKLA